MPKTSKVDKQHNIDRKIIYQDACIYQFELQNGYETCVSVEDSITRGTDLCSKVSSSTQEKVEVPLRHSIKLEQQIQEGDVLGTTGKLRKKEIKSPFTGIVKEVSDTFVTLQVEDNDEPESTRDKGQTRAPLTGKVIQISGQSVFLSFSAVTFNLVASKGESVVASVKYLESTAFKDKKNLPENVEGTIVFTDFLTADIYPVIAALGAKGIITFGVDYSLYRDMILLAVPVGVFGGYGKLKDDPPIVKYLKKASGNISWFDTSYNRLIISEKKEPVWLKKYKYNFNIYARDYARDKT